MFSLPCREDVLRYHFQAASLTATCIWAVGIAHPPRREILFVSREACIRQRELLYVSLALRSPGPASRAGLHRRQEERNQIPIIAMTTVARPRKTKFGRWPFLYYASN